MFSVADLDNIKESLQRRWAAFHRPVHAFAYLVHPKFWDDANAMDEVELVTGTHETIHRLLPPDQAILAITQLTTFR